MIDISDKNDRLTVGCFVVNLSDWRLWIKERFLKWNCNRRYPDQAIGYKKVKEDKLQMQELKEFLDLLNLCNGLVLSVTFPKSDDLILTHREDVSVDENLEEFRHWKPSRFERLMRVSYAVSLATETVTSHPERWLILHDRDEILEEPTRLDASKFISSFISCTQGEDFAYKPLTTKSDIQISSSSKALLAIPDLMAGGMSSILSQPPPPIDESGTYTSLRMRSKDRLIADWASIDTAPLRKVALSLWMQIRHFYTTGVISPRYSRLEFHADQRCFDFGPIALEVDDGKCKL